MILISVFVSAVLLNGCGNYKPPYDRGYEEGYAAGVASVGESVSGDTVPEPKLAESALPSLMPAKTEENDTASEEAAAASDEESAAEDAGSSEGTSAGEVLGEEGEPSGGSDGSGGIPEGRVIRADAVNEALYSNPEVIDGLRMIYAD
ncbi:MAG: hypothetical protein J5966_05550, partial [Lachnospiraceae bacterium]|nr:hypothetical protein [Lachnospiraceae bacterium]